jgi:hypothetical protein
LCVFGMRKKRVWEKRELSIHADESLDWSRENKRGGGVPPSLLAHSPALFSLSLSLWRGCHAAVHGSAARLATHPYTPHTHTPTLSSWLRSGGHVLTSVPRDPCTILSLSNTYTQDISSSFLYLLFKWVSQF